MWTPIAERWVHRAIWSLLLAGLLQRAFVVIEFGQRYIGIDDALIQQVAIDYGQGIFREPYLYGQNYNPMLEALLAAPFVRLGVAPWIVLPIITSLLALLPFWSPALWCQRKGHLQAALVFSALPLLLPIEWSLITTMPRGFVHGLALLALVPWCTELKHALPRYWSTAFVLAAAVWCNPNALPLSVGFAVWLGSRYGRQIKFWVMGLLGVAPIVIAYLAGRNFFVTHPEALIHELSTTDLGFYPHLLKEGLLHLNDHLLHMTPFFPATAGAIVLGIIPAAWIVWRRQEGAIALALVTPLAIYLFALGIAKVHEGCASIFFPLSRMFLGMPLLLSTVLAVVLVKVRLTGVMLGSILILATGHGVRSAYILERTIREELASQSCAYVREEPLVTIRERCLAIKEEAEASGANVIVPIRWPGIRVDHAGHFVPHFTCYACGQLVEDFPATVGIGFDRRTWVRERYSGKAPGRVLLIGGDPQAWRDAVLQHPGIESREQNGLLFHTLSSDSSTIQDIILRLGVDDDLRR